MSCKLTGNLNNKECKYVLAGASALYLANWYPMVEATTAPTTPPVKTIVYVKDSDGRISEIHLPTGEKFYEMGAGDNTVSFGDALLAGGNGGKYRQHTINAVLNQYDQDLLEQGDALSLGRYVGIVVDKGSVSRILGRTGGLSAPAGGMDYSSGTAEADAVGWTMIQQGSSTEIAPILKNLSGIDIAPDPVVVP